MKELLCIAGLVMVGMGVIQCFDAVVQYGEIRKLNLEKNDIDQKMKKFNEKHREMLDSKDKRAVRPTMDMVEV